MCEQNKNINRVKEAITRQQILELKNTIIQKFTRGFQWKT